MPEMSSVRNFDYLHGAAGYSKLMANTCLELLYICTFEHSVHLGAIILIYATLHFVPFLPELHFALHIALFGSTVYCPMVYSVQCLDFCLEKYGYSLAITYLSWLNLTTIITARLYLAPAGGLFATLALAHLCWPNLTMSIAVCLYLVPAEGGLFVFPGYNPTFYQSSHIHAIT